MRMCAACNPTRVAWSLCAAETGGAAVGWLGRRRTKSVRAKCLPRTLCLGWLFSDRLTQRNRDKRRSITHCRLAHSNPTVTARPPVSAALHFAGPATDGGVGRLPTRVPSLACLPDLCLLHHCLRRLQPFGGLLACERALPPTPISLYSNHHRPPARRPLNTVAVSRSLFLSINNPLSLPHPRDRPNTLTRLPPPSHDGLDHPPQSARAVLCAPARRLIPDSRTRNPTASLAKKEDEHRSPQAPFYIPTHQQGPHRVAMQG